MTSPLFTDLYQLTMLAGYFRNGLHAQPATFDLLFRRAPFKGSYALWAGLDTALDYLAGLRFKEAHLTYLRGLGLFDEAFLGYLAEWRFTGTVTAFPEASVVFAHEPLLTVEAPLGEAQLVETALLNILNFQTLIATKAARAVRAAGSSPHGGSVVEFGARRAQGEDGALSAARAAFIGGATATSNVEAGAAFGLPVTGTHAHAWVEAFPSELEAFRAYAAAFPDTASLLLDTYDTLGSGLPNALTVAGEMRSRGQLLRSVRLDSGDLAYLSRRVRGALDAAGFTGTRIVASNDLDEFVIDSVIREGGRVDVYGVGTQLVTGGGEGGGALGGVYKLAQLDGRPTMKLTADRAKATLPGRKRVWRVRNEEGRPSLDVIALEGEWPVAGQTLVDPANPLNRTRLEEGQVLTEAREVVFESGKRTQERQDLRALQARASAELRSLPAGTTRLLNPHVYRVALSEGLATLRRDLITELEERSSSR